MTHYVDRELPAAAEFTCATGAVAKKCYVQVLDGLWRGFHEINVHSLPLSLLGTPRLFRNGRKNVVFLNAGDFFQVGKQSLVLLVPCLGKLLNSSSSPPFPIHTRPAPPIKERSFVSK